jgi:hypothetical protein
MRTQSEITEIWDAIGQGRYGNDPAIRKPRRVVDDAVEQVLSIPTEDGIGLARKFHHHQVGSLVPWRVVMGI